MLPESCSKELANRAMYLCDNHDPINQGHVLFFVFQFELTLSPTASYQKFQLDPPFLTGKNIVSSNLLYHCVILSKYEKIRSMCFACTREVNQSDQHGLVVPSFFLL